FSIVEKKLCTGVYSKINCLPCAGLYGYALVRYTPCYKWQNGAWYKIANIIQRNSKVATRLQAHQLIHKAGINKRCTGYASCIRIPSNSVFKPFSSIGKLLYRYITFTR